VSRTARLPLESLQPFLLDVPHPRYLRPEQLPTEPPRIDWPTLFGNPGPVEIEVGFGKGMFLVESAKARPTVNFLGIEIERKYTLATATRLARQSLTNVKLACTDARWFFKAYVSDRSVDAVHVYFPDPWWKQKHKKRLLFTAEFALEVARILKSDGSLHFATDVEEYFTQTRELVRQQERLREVDVSEPAIVTNFERKYRLEGRAIHRMRFAVNETAV
jgi:tRNA (guanine-N7-)-methyltransferase